MTHKQRAEEDAEITRFSVIVKLPSVNPRARFSRYYCIFNTFLFSQLTQTDGRNVSYVTTNARRRDCLFFRELERDFICCVGLRFYVIMVR